MKSCFRCTQSQEDHLKLKKTVINQLSGLNVPPGTIAKHIADLHGKRLSANDIQNMRQKNKEHNEKLMMFLKWWKNFARKTPRIQ